jgi:amidophosphoribosyltransferase
MCGIFGVSGSDNAAAELYFGMLHLQHRGQDAAGMVVYDRRKGARIIREKGFVSEIFTQKKISSLTGRMGIGHTRYPTVGVNSVEEVQPFFVHHPDGIALAFNGNVVNYPILKDRLRKEKRVYLSSSCDAEALLHIFAEEYGKKKGVKAVFGAVSRVYEEVVGGYAVVAMIAGKGVLAFKDPNGIRPLLVGERKNGRTTYAFSSESIALSIQGYSKIRDLKPGEAIFVDVSGKMHAKVLRQEKHTPCVFEWVYFSTVESTLEGQAVYTVRERLGQELAKKVQKLWPNMEIDLVIAVPDTSRPAANSLANSLGLPYGEALVKNRYVGRTFIMPTQKIREEALALKMKPIEPMIKGKRIMVVDDSIVRGTTSKRIVQLLRNSGAKKVYLLSTYPPIRNPCFYGIDFQSREDLIAHNRKIKEIEREIGADKLIYMDIQALKRAVGRDSLCMACVTGEYPTDISSSVQLAKMRKADLAKVQPKC